MIQDYSCKFYRNFILLSVLVLSSFAGNAQVDIPIGTGTTGNTNTGYPCPLQDRWEGSHAQYLYQAVELQNAGMSAGMISAIKFEVTSLNGFTGSLEAFTVKLSTTSNPSLGTTTWEPAGAILFGPVDFVPVVGINTIQLTTPFFWNGTDNIVVEICNGDPTSLTSITYTWNVTVPWTTGLSFNGSRTYALDDAGGQCDYQGTTDGSITNVPTTRPNIIFTWTSATSCTGTPVGGTAVSSATGVCNPTSPFTVSVTGATSASGLTYQWQSSPNNTAWTNLTGATAPSYTSPGIASDTWFRRIINCGAGTNTSTSVQVSYIIFPAYTNLPYAESFENTWMCNTREVPNKFWKNTPTTGNNSWRRSDDPSSAGWTSNNGLYTPNASAGTYSARFHTYDAPNGTKGQLDLYINCNTAAITKELSFDYINTTGNDSLVVFYSTNGGVSFTRLDSFRLSAIWTTKTLYFNSTSTSTVIRFEATSDYGSTDIGVDNLNLIDFPNCSGTPTGGTTVSSVAAVCNPTTPFTLSVTGATNAGGLTYQWQVSTDGGATWTNTTGATGVTYTSPGISTNTSFRRQIICFANSSFSTPVTVTVLTPTYATLPFSESFENTWIDICSTHDAPNNSWRNTPATGNNSWRRDDDGASGGWGATGTGMYSPAASDGIHSARFHTWLAPNGSKGILDLYLNCNTGVATKILNFDFINPAGVDSLVIKFSTDNGQTFTRLDSVRVSEIWRTETIQFTSLSATTVIRFEATSDFGFGITDIGLDNIMVANFPQCSGTPTGGTTNSNFATVCNSTTPFTLTVTGSTFAAGLTYQWQFSTDGGTTWNNTTGATSASYTSPGITVPTSFRRQIICGALSSFSTPITITFTTPSYTTLPYAESFENTWINSCGTRDVPNIYWKNTPSTGNNSWRRNDDGAAAAWTNAGLGIYTPNASAGIYSARFHSYNATFGTKGQFDLYVNANTGAAVHRLTFDFINTSGNDSLSILFSFNGGTSFTRIDSAGIATAWRTKTMLFASTSPTTVIRFEATSDDGVTDIGLDNISVIEWADCTGTPNGGTVTTTATSVCSESFTINAIGITSGNGVTYQWQRSSDNGLNWGNIPGANNFSLTTTQVGTTLYRLVTTCIFSSQSATSNSVQVISPLPAKGTYTINSAVPTDNAARTFRTFNDAYNYIKCGIDSAVLFNVINGPYNEQLIMTLVPGATATKTVTFKGNGTAAIGFSSTNSNERAVIKLRKVNYIIIDSLIINATSGTYGYGVQLVNDADSNIIRNCTINSSMTSTTQNFAGIVTAGDEVGPITTGTTTALCDDNLFENNTIKGGYYGITLFATFAGGAHGGNKYIKNDVRDFYFHGMYVGGAYNTLIESNRFSRPTRATVGEFQGISFNTQKVTGSSVSKNRIYDPFAAALTSTSTFYGIHFNSSDGSVGAENYVVNNLIYDVKSNGPAYGIANTGSDQVFYLHNTVSLDHVASAATGLTRGFSQTTVAGGLFFYNNLISITRGGNGAKHCIYLGNNLLAGSDYNDFYINAVAGTNYIGYYLQNRATLADWRTATNLDANSISANPAFTDPSTGNYAPGNAGIDNQGVYVGVDTDILNVPRSQTNPDIGAYEFTPPLCNIPPVTGPTSISPLVICQNSPAYLTLNIGAYGSGQRFQWQTSGTATGTYTNLGTPMLTPDTTIFGSATQYYRVAITCGATTTFTTPVLLTVNPALPSATYTINKNSATTYVPGVPGGNFVSFNAAKAAMSCGITGGPVVFNVVSGTGPYTEQLRLDSIAGTSAVNTITFNGNGNTITFNSTNTAERAIIKLNGADYIIFDSLVINAGTGTYGYGVQLLNRADSNTFRRCTIISSTTSTSQNFSGVVINATEAGPISTGQTYSDFNLFDRNTIIGGYYGITVVGGTAVADFISQNRFTNNNIRDFFNSGMYLAGTVNTLIEGNTFSRPTSTLAITNVYGIYLTTAISNKLSISKNRFTDFFTAIPTSLGAFYGIYHNSVDAITGNESIVSNNIIYSLGGNGIHYGFYNTASNGVKYYHNTIAFDNTQSTATAATAGFYQTTAAVNLDFRNNIVTVTRGGTGIKHAIYLNTATSEVLSNNNNLYVSGTNAHVGYNGANRTSLAQWQSSSAKDANSFSTNPLYTDSANGNFKPQLALLDNKGTSVGITTDIENTSRSTTTPDIGAYEFAPLPCQAPPVAGTASVNPSSGICLEVPIELNVTGHSALGNITFQWQNSASATGPWTDLGAPQYFPQYNTTTTISRFFRAIVTCNASTSITNVISVNLNNILLAGTYTIDPSQPSSTTNYQSFQAAVNALLCGVGGPVIFNVESGTYNEQIRIPYIPGTSPVNTVTFQSKTGVATSVNLTYNSTVAVNNYTLKLDSTKYFTFRNLTFTAINPLLGRVIDLSTTSSSDNILNCRIVAPVSTSNSNFNVGIYANLFKGSDIVIKGNTILNGSNGIYFSGTSPLALTIPDNFIDSNEVSGSYTHGIHVQFANDIKVRKNTVNLSGTLAANTAGIYFNTSDSAFRLTGNNVNINNVTSGPTYGLQVLNTRALGGDSAIVSANTVLADQGNTNTVYGLAVAASKGVYVVNNVIGINSSGATAYGLYNLNNLDSINYYNNTVNLVTPGATGFAGYFQNTAVNKVIVKNNIFSNKGGGKALYVDNPVNYSADYNMLYTTGPLLVQVATGAVTTFPSLLLWQKTWNWDRTSITFPPEFVSNTNLRPNLVNPDVWAMHGRGVQVRGNTVDFNGNYRPDFLTAGVPDLGAFEFYPTALPSVLLATPATPAPNTQQTFSYGTDTVMRITWGAIAPPSVEVRRFSGVVPTGLTPGTDSMFFYTKVDIPGGTDYAYSTRLYYIDSWQGSIPQQSKLGLGRTTPSNAWVVGASSKVDVSKKEIRQDALFYLDRFTGLTNPFAQEEPEDSSSNRGKDFWVGYQRTNGFSDGNSQNMVIYMGSGAVPANVTITIEGTTGTPWVRNYQVPANSALASEIIPKVGSDDARLINEGRWNKKGIHITSDVPIVAYAHIYESTNSGATMLMPTSVWGFEYYTLQSRQNYTSVSYSAFHIVAKDDSTWVEINPSVQTLSGWVPNGGTQPNGSYLVKLNKGDAYQVLGSIQSGAEGRDLTGSYVKSISNGQGQCHPIAVFAGSTRTGIGCGTSPGSSGDLIIQQIFPYQAWGNQYATAPTSIQTGPTATSNSQNIFRVLVKDPTTIVTRNGVTLTNLINNRYYQFESNTGNYIQSNKPVLVAQFMSSSGNCPNTAGDGDPEMFYISPIQQAIKSTQFYRNNLTAIDENFITLVIPTEGLASLRIDGVNWQTYPVALRYAYDHPNLPGYSVVTKKWIGGNGSSTVESDFAFTGIVYGIGSVESYGYNLGTLVKNLNNLGSVNNVFNTGSTPTDYTCKGAPFRIRVLLPVTPDSILWKFSQVPKLTPNADSLQRFPTAIDTVTVNGIDYYSFSVNQIFTIDSAGIFAVPLSFWSLEIESCDKRKDGKVFIQVLPAPLTDFTIGYPNGGTSGCAGDLLTFTGSLVTQNGIALNQWDWTFHDAATATGRITSKAYPTPGNFPVKLTGITADGCIADTVKTVVINVAPVVNVLPDSIAICPGGTATFTIQNPTTGAVYRWYDQPTGGTLLFTGPTFIASNVTPLPKSFYVDGSVVSCTTPTRKKVTVGQLPALTPSVATFQGSTANSVTFAWTAVANAVKYDVSINGGPFVVPSSGAAGLTHTVSGLGILQSVSIVVQATGSNSCQTSLSNLISGCTNSSAVVVPDSIAVCTGTPAVFNVQNPATGITYRWYTTATGGTPVATGSTFSVTATGTAVYYVEQSSATCVGTPRTRVVVSILAPLSQTIATFVSSTVNSITWSWTAVPGAASYQVSIDNGVTFTTPSSGPTGLTHTIGGLAPLQQVTLIVRATGIISCQTSVSVGVPGRTKPDQIYIPNSFTPNGDGLNDVLLVYSYVIRDMQFAVFNQWGEKIFESTTQSIGWNGTAKGKPQPSGVYMYVGKFTLLDGTSVTRKGSINLIR